MFCKESYILLQDPHSFNFDEYVVFIYLYILNQCLVIIGYFKKSHSNSMGVTQPNYLSTQFSSEITIYTVLIHTHTHTHTNTHRYRKSLQPLDQWRCLPGLYKFSFRNVSQKLVFDDMVFSSTSQQSQKAKLNNPQMQFSQKRKIRTQKVLEFSPKKW